MYLNKKIIFLTIFLILILLISFLFRNVFETFSNDNKFIEYYSMSKCPHCISFNPIWEQFEKKTNTKKYVIDKENVDDKLDKYDISGFPTIIVTENGKKIDELTERSLDGLINLCKKHNMNC